MSRGNPITNSNKSSKLGLVDNSRDNVVSTPLKNPTILKEVKKPTILKPKSTKNDVSNKPTKKSSET
jgi:hypothetical protein